MSSNTYLPLEQLSASPPFLTQPDLYRQSRFAGPLVQDGGTFAVPVTINGQLTLIFVVDSGASDVSVPLMS